MEIKEYAIVWNYGYGVYESTYDGRFIENATVLQSLGGNNPGYGSGINDIISPPFGRIIVPGHKQQLLHLVSDGRQWYEYFTGLPVEVLNFDAVNGSGIGRFVVLEYSLLHAKVQPKDFEAAIGKYNDAQIADMVRQFTTLVNNAPIWAQNRDAMIAELERIRLEQNAAAANNIGSNVGRFAGAGYDPNAAPPPNVPPVNPGGQYDPNTGQYNPGGQYDPNTGQYIPNAGQYYPPQGQYPPPQGTGGLRVNRITYGVLAIVLGCFGVQKFMAGKTGQGVLCILFSWTSIPTIIGIIDGIKALTTPEAPDGTIEV